MPKVVAGLVCDDVRFEISGKQTIIGVYTGGVIVPEFPAQVAAAFWMQAKFEDRGTHQVNFSVRQNDLPIGDVKGTVEIYDTANAASLNLPAIMFDFQRPGALSLFVQFGDAGEWQEVVSKRVSTLEEAAPVAI